MFKYIFIVFLIFFVGCKEEMPTVFEYDNKEQLLNFHIEDEYFNVKLNNPFYQNRINPCTKNSYTLYSQDSHFGRIGIENININSNCIWNKTPQTSYEEFLKKQLKANTFYSLQRIKMKNYEFITYSVNDESILNIIHINGKKQNTFILDYKGKLFDKLLKKLKPDFNNKYRNHPRFESVLNKSIIKDDISNSYFGRKN